MSAVMLFLFVFFFADDFDPMTDDPENEGRCSVVIALMQIQNKKQCRADAKNLQIGFILYQVKIYIFLVLHSLLYIVLTYLHGLLPMSVRCLILLVWALY